ncbi:hypothetical protein PGIGA_G00072430 [Pangasianodon gigas]|uniref:Uncharacterized protein n=1 Tax=Pangasianodon gigas TaxID=30993 RepID=A0ACC5X7Z7_PANGG|nr:hypothetical protein [Pangasianodon gigas]
MFWDWGRKPENPEETPKARGEHASSAHAGQRRDSSPQPQSDRRITNTGEEFRGRTGSARSHIEAVYSVLRLRRTYMTHMRVHQQ